MATLLARVRTQGGTYPAVLDDGTLSGVMMMGLGRAEGAVAARAATEARRGSCFVGVGVEQMSILQGVLALEGVM